MDFLRHYLLTILIFLPGAGAGAIMFVRGKNAIRWTALGVALGTFVGSLLLLITFDWHAGQSYAYAEDGGVVQMVLRLDWIKPFNIQYLVGIDGLSLPLVLLTTFISVLACLASWKIDQSIRGFLAMLLVLESSALGTFLSLDLFLFYLFFELTLVPVYFLISIWGGPQRRNAAIKFFVCSLIASVALLIAMIGIYLGSRQIYPLGTFDLIKVAGHDFGGENAEIFFALLMVAFLIRLPAVPLHPWLADSHEQAPVPLSMAMSALLLNAGGYGIFRIAYPLFPGAAKSLWLIFALIGLISIFYGALCAIAQTDLKRLAAFNTISNMGLVILGAAMLTDTAMHGAIFILICVGVSSGAIFFVSGMIFDRTRHCEISRLGGLFERMPVLSGLGIVSLLAAMGLPGLCVFVGEIMVLLGSFQAARPGGILYKSAAIHGNLRWFLPSVWVLASLACFAMVLTAVYILRSIQRIFLGGEKPEFQTLDDLKPRETTVLAALTVVSILLGIFPTPLVFNLTGQTVAAIFALLQKSHGI